MHDLSIKPYVGVGDLRLGMARDVVRKVIGEAYEVFRRGLQDVTDSDAFYGTGVYVYYDSRDECEAIEFAEPAKPTLFGEPLIGRPIDQVLAYLRKHDASVSVDDSGATAYTIGLGVYAPAAAKRSDCPVESVIIFRRNYYD